MRNLVIRTTVLAAGLTVALPASAQLIDGSQFSTAIGMGTASFPPTPFGTPAVFVNGPTENYTLSVIGAPMRAFATLQTDSLTGNDVLTIDIASTDSAEIFPTGATFGGQPLISAGFFAVSIFGDPVLETSGPTFGVSLVYDFFADGSLVSSITAPDFVGEPLGDISANFGDAVVGIGVDQLVVTVETTVIPAPGAAAALGAIGGLTIVRRRRR